MKKIIALLLTVGCLATFLALPVGAASANEVDFIVNTDGQNITIDVETNFACGSLQGALKFDEVSYKEIEINDSIKSKNTINDTVKVVDKAVKLAFVGDVDNGTLGKWATLSFEGSKAKFDFTSAKVYAIDGSLAEATVYVVYRGDANDDGVINIKDLVRLKKVGASVLEPVAGKEKNCDVNADGEKANSNDLVKLRQILIGA